MAVEASDKVQLYKDNLKTKAEKLVIKGFPEKIVEFNKLLETPLFNHKDMSKLHHELNIPVPEPIVVNSHNSEPPSKKRNHEGNYISEVDCPRIQLKPGSAPSNKLVSELIDIVKPHIKQLVEDANLLKMWISYMIPKIEDGNNFGVSVQEDTLAEIQSVESEAATYFDQISRYYVSRGKIVSKVAKYPAIEDYRQAVRELDEKEYLSLWIVMCEIRNRYCTLHDIVIKNIEKIKKPRSCNSESLY
uniref:Proteasome activator PA28 C-terminal domain-containing protein n=1 Tax=Clastoptera arizonana TaxID=38151 RepID=A0A1B6DS01_9HEMI